MMNDLGMRLGVALALGAAALGTGRAFAEPDDPEVVFRNPPQRAKTGVWWHWMGTGVSKEGIVRDLDWFRDMGVGMATVFAVADTMRPGGADLKGGPMPDLVGGTPDWWRLLRFAVEEAAKRGIEIGVHNCPGYSHTGGPWVKPEHAMRDLVFEIPGETSVTNYVDKREIARLTVKGKTVVVSHVAKPSFTGPTQAKARGYECDKMSAEAVNAHWDRVLGDIRTHLGDWIGKGFNFVHADSYEAKRPSWTPRMREEFLARRGYDPLPLLPALAGMDCCPPEKAKAFRADFTKTIRELYRDVVFRLSAERLHAAGLEFSCEPYGDGVIDTAACGGYVDRLMNEFWTHGAPWHRPLPPQEKWTGRHAWERLTRVSDGRHPNVIEAEAFTGWPEASRWSETPAQLKRVGDFQYASGVNRFVLHSVPLQPWGDGIRPGMSFGCWGTHFGRTQTWAKDGKAWFDYLNRCQALLQWGEPAGAFQRRKGGVTVRFEVNGSTTNRTYAKRGEWFDAVTGRIGAPPATLEPGQSGFLVTGRPGRTAYPPAPVPTAVADVKGPWTISWRSAAPGVALPDTTAKGLFDWTKSTDPEIRHFSGTAAFRTTFDCADPAAVTGLSLGDIQDQLVRVRLNGVDLGVVWCRPTRVAVPAGLVKAKGNVLELEHTNVWANRLIGDEAYPPIAEWKSSSCLGRAIGAYPAAYPAFLRTGCLPQGTKRTSFSMWNYFTKDSPLVPSGTLGPVRLLRDVPPTVTAVLCDSPAGVVKPTDRAVLRLQKGFSPAGLKWTLRDWFGRAVARGDWPADGALTLDPLPAGYYNLYPETQDGVKLRRTSLAVIEPMAEKLPKDSFFAIMSALACVANPNKGDFPWFDRDWPRVCADLLATLGIPNSREIEFWPADQPKRGVAPTRPKHWQKCVDYLAERGVGIEMFYEKAPAWADVDGKLPRDLKAVYDFSRWLAADLGAKASGIEFWNEEDLDHYAPEAVWDYAVAMKAAYLGVKAGSRTTPFLHGALCQRPFTDYNRLLFANDVAKYSDVINYHSYAALAERPGQVDGVRKLMAEAGVPNRAIWFTELNTNQEGNSTEESVRAGNKAHSEDQEKVLVEYVAKGEIAMMMQGVARAFYFILPGLNEREGKKDWGLTRRDGTVKPAYAALATLVRRIGTAKLEGEVKVGEGLKAYLFTHADGRQTLVCWTISDLDRFGEVKPWPLGEHEILLPGRDAPGTREAPGRDAPGTRTVMTYDACGVRTECDVSKPLRLTRYPTYVTGLRGLVADVPAAKPGKVEFHDFASDEDPTVLVKVDLDPADFTLGGNKTVAELKRKTGRAKLTVWNLDGRAKRGSLSVCGGTFRGLPDEIEVAPWGKAAFETEFRPDPPAPGGFTTPVTVGGTFGERRLTTLKMQVQATAELLAQAKTVELKISDLKRWQRNDSAKSFALTWDETEQAVRMELEWEASHGDRWFYPRYRLALPEESCDGAMIVEYEAKMEQDKIENDVAFSHLMIARDGKLDYCAIPPATGSWEKRRLVVPQGSSRNITGLQFGCGPKGYKVKFLIRNVRAYRLPVADVPLRPYEIGGGL